MPPDFERTAHPARQKSGSTGWALASLGLSSLLAALGTSIANVGLPAFQTAFAAPFAAVQWVVLSYLLAMTTLVVSAGRLGDMLGHRRLLLAGIFLFALASLLCAAAPTLPLLVVARALQGLGAAVMMALAMALVSETVPAGRTGSAMGLLGTLSAVGTALGPSAGGLLLASSAGWRGLFIVMVPAALLTLVLVWRRVPGKALAAGKARPRFDRAGTAVLAGSLAAYALAMTLGRHDFTGTALPLLAAALAGAGLFLFIESRTEAPLIRLEAIGRPVIGSGLVASFLVSAVMMATLVVGPFHLARALGLSAALTGIALSTGPVVAALAGVPAGRLVDRFGSRRMSLAGLTVMIAGTGGLGFIPQSLGTAGYLCPLALLTAGYALFQAANNTGVMAGIGPSEKGAVSGLLTLSRNLGLITGATAMGALFALAAGTEAISTAAPAAVAAGTRLTFLAGLGLVGLALAALLADGRRHREN
ncbi:MFS transporter [Radicibacter daui]|uniref:MFS transporter n=1 Tax=Radicibacter daui TaxID=3064829 RepID=UPI004046A1EB